MSLFRNIGNRFRRADALDPTTPLDVPTTSAFDSDMSKKLLPGVNTMMNSTMNTTTLLPHHDDNSNESPDLYYEDRPLGVSIHALEQVRAALRHLKGCADDHARTLEASSCAQRSLGDALTRVLLSTSSDQQRHRDSQHDLENNNQTNGSNNLATVMPDGAADAQQSLGEGLSHLAQVSAKLSVAISKPISELTDAFETRYMKKIVPLRKRYADQKGQYLKYMRSADMAESDEKRSYYEALADAAKPVWARTSTELRTEADVMTELTAKNIAQWSRTIALQHERAFAISNANMADAFSRAKHLGTLHRS